MDLDTIKAEIFWENIDRIWPQPHRAGCPAPCVFFER